VGTPTCRSDFIENINSFVLTAMSAVVVALNKRIKPRAGAPRNAGGDQDDAGSDSSEINAGALVDEEFEDSNSLLGVMPTPETALIQGLLQKIDYRGHWSQRQGQRFHCH
jgi:hypothetical protein